MRYPPLDLSQLKVLPLAERASLTRADTIMVDPSSAAAALNAANRELVATAADSIRRARRQGAAVMLIYGAHLLRNGAARIVDRLVEQQWITHLATNGAGTIHDWEYAWHGASTESVEMNVASGTFGTWNETAANIHWALLSGALDELGYGESLGRFIHYDGATLPDPAELAALITRSPGHRLTSARADMLTTMERLGTSPGRLAVHHRFKEASIVASAYAHDVPLTVHPGIGYDIISNHPIFNGAVIGRAGERDFKQFGAAVDRLDEGVVLNIGSAIMGPQVFEKALSCVNNLRLQSGRAIVRGHEVFVVDIQDGGGWDWTTGEPPKTNPAYYLRFCKSFARMGARMRYAQCDNLAFVHHLYKHLAAC